MQSAATFQLCHCSMKAAIDIVEVNVCDYCNKFLFMVNTKIEFNMNFMSQNIVL